MKYILLIVYSLFLCASFASAGEVSRLIAVQGESRIEVEPNQVIVSIEVKHTRATLDGARQDVGATLKKTVSVLIEQGVNEKNIEKTQIWQGPDYQWENNQRVLKGYNASIQLKVRVDDLQHLAKMLDALAKIESATIQETRFTRADALALQAEQRKLALLDAKQKAIQMLAVYNATLGAVLTIREGGSPPPIAYGKMEMRMASMADEAPEPAAWAKVTISADVQVEFAIE